MIRDRCDANVRRGRKKESKDIAVDATHSVCAAKGDETLENQRKEYGDGEQHTDNDCYVQKSFFRSATLMKTAHAIGPAECTTQTRPRLLEEYGYDKQYGEDGLRPGQYISEKFHCHTVYRKTEKKQCKV